LLVKAAFSHKLLDPYVPCLPAEVYETSTETLFLGKQDAMQRQTLVPLHHHMRGKPAGGVGMKCLEVACGTGRFATFIKVGCSDEKGLWNFRTQNHIQIKRKIEIANPSLES
jgi:hypothetical protein